MTRNKYRLPLLLLALLVTHASIGLCQSPDRTGSTRRASEKPPGSAPISGVRFDSGNRRDPFLNLLLLRKKKSDDAIVESPTILPPGIAGMRIHEVALSGTSQREGAITAVVRGTDKRTYFLRVGDRLLDGYVKKIETDSVLFVQETKLRSGKVNTQEISKRLRAN